MTYHEPPASSMTTPRDAREADREEFAAKRERFAEADTSRIYTRMELSILLRRLAAFPWRIGYGGLLGSEMRWFFLQAADELDRYDQEHFKRRQQS